MERPLPTVKVERYITRGGAELWKVSHGKRDMLLSDEALVELTEKAREARNEKINEGNKEDHSVR